MAKDIGLGGVFRGVLYFLPAYILCIILFMAVPEIITYLPGLIYNFSVGNRAGA